MTVGGFERLLLTTGSGNDIVKNTQVAVSDWIDTRGGNDVIALSGVTLPTKATGSLAGLVRTGWTSILPMTAATSR